MWTYIMATARGDPTRALQAGVGAPNGRLSSGLATRRIPASLPPLRTLPLQQQPLSLSKPPSLPPLPVVHQQRHLQTQTATFPTSSVPTVSTSAPPLLAEVRVHTHATTDHAPHEGEAGTTATSASATWSRRLWSALRGTYRRVGSAIRGAPKPRAPRAPDWFLDKFNGSQRNKGDEDGGGGGGARTTGGGAVHANDDAPTCWGHRIVVDPTLPSHYRWLGVVSLAVLYNIIFVIGRAVFWELNNLTPGLWWTMDYVCDFIYVLDTIVHAHEGYLEQGLLVTDSRLLRAHYMQKKRWRTDLLSLLPTDLAYCWWSPFECHITVPCPVIVRTNRLFRMPRMWEWFERTETATGYPNAFRICKVVLAILVLIHWNACLYFAISYAVGFGTDNWVYNLNGPRNSSLARQYIYSFYWSTLTLTTIGETPQPENDAEYLFVVADFLAGVLIFATIVGNIGSMISNMNVARVDFQNRMDGVKQYMAFRKVGRELEERVIRWFAYTWSQSGALDEERVLAALPEKLKAEIAIRVHLDTLRQVRIFQDCEPGLLEALVLKLRLQVFSPGDYICRKGDVGKELYIVKRGRLQVVADDGTTVFATLGAGSVFGEVSVLDIVGNRTGNRRTANVRSLGYSDLFCLAKDDLWVALADYPDARASLTEIGCQMLRKDGLLDEDVFKNAQAVQESLNDSVARLQSTVNSLHTRLARLLAEYAASQAKIKQRLAKIETSSGYDDSDADGCGISGDRNTTPEDRHCLTWRRTQQRRGGGYVVRYKADGVHQRLHVLATKRFSITKLNQVVI